MQTARNLFLFRQVYCQANNEDGNQYSQGYQQDYGTARPMREFEKDT